MEDAAVTVAQMCIDIAVLDPIRPGIYARLCLALSERLRAPRQEIFIEELLNKLGADFDAGYDARTPPHLQATARRKYVGLVRFLVAVYEVCMLEEATIHDCVKILFESSSEADMEALCVILNASGPLLDTSAAAADLDDYFSRISEWCLDVKVPIRIRFMLQDLSDRRAHKWVEAERNHLDIIVAMPLEPDPEEGKYLNDAILAVKVQSVFPPDQDLRLACRDPEYVPTLITLLVQEVISSQDENIMALVSKFLEFVLSHDLVLTSAVVFGFVLALKDRHLPRDALRPLRHLVNAAGLDDERGEGILDRAVAAASEDSPEVPVEDHHLHLNPSEAQGTFDAIAAALSLPAPILPSQERVPCDLFVVWLARIKELKDEASRRRQEVADIRADRRLAKILDAAQKLTDKRDTAEKKRAVEQSLRVSAENALNTQKAANLTMENDLREVRARCTEIEAELQRIKVRNTVEVASADTSRDDGRDEMLEDMIALLVLKRDDERQTRRSQQDQVAREMAEQMQDEEVAALRAKRESGALRERSRCLRRDEKYTTAQRWTDLLAFERFETVLLGEGGFVKRRFTDSVPLTFEAVPWPVLARPWTYNAKSIKAENARAFWTFMAATTPKSTAYPVPADYRKYLLKQGLLAFHPDQMEPRLSTVQDPEIREQIWEATNIIRETLDELILLAK